MFAMVDSFPCHLNYPPRPIAELRIVYEQYAPAHVAHRWQAEDHGSQAVYERIKAPEMARQ